MRSFFSLLLVVLFVSPALAVLAEEPRPDSNQEQDDASTSPHQVNSLLEKLTVHGFLTQAYATSDITDGGPSSSEIALGIPENGTFDYRSLALQFRFAITADDIVIVQLSHEANGNAPADAFRDEIELDWSFYERRLGPSSSIKVGRIPTPFGIFNEIRDVGTLFPFYRPSFAVYSEGSFTNETVDGLQISHAFEGRSAWRLNVDAYFGEFETLEAVPGAEPDLKPLFAKDVLGIQLWLDTPMTGLRLGLAAQSKELSGGQEGFTRPVGSESSLDEWMASVDGSFEKWTLRGEYRTIQFEEQTPIFGNLDSTFHHWYVQAGWNVNEKVSIWAQHEVRETRLESAALTAPADFESLDDTGIAINYTFGPSMVLKAEYHWLESDSLAFIPIFLPGPNPGVNFQPEPDRLEDGSYGILALAVSF